MAVHRWKSWVGQIGSRVQGLSNFASLVFRVLLWMWGYCDIFKWTLLRQTSPDVRFLHWMSSRRKMCTPSVSDVIYHKCSHSAASYTVSGKTVNIMLELAFNPIALRKAKIVYNFGLSECSRVKFVHTNLGGIAELSFVTMILQSIIAEYVLGRKAFRDCLKLLFRNSVLYIFFLHFVSQPLLACFTVRHYFLLPFSCPKSVVIGMSLM